MLREIRLLSVAIVNLLGSFLRFVLRRPSDLNEFLGSF
jgi:hypothetical protein